ncbi:MAG: MFS transporter [Alphaproteobacteria bacterium]|nr:MFS transporter [Alphaproteobacteria bacterium]
MTYHPPASPQTPFVMSKSSESPTIPADDQSLAYRFYDLATGEDDARLCRDIPESQCREEPKSFSCQIFAQVLSKSGDVLADGKVVLPWLLGAVGAPLYLVGLLVPIRESLALLPQILVGGVIRRFPVRKGFWVASSLIEGLCVLAMGLVALMGLRGATAGWTIVALLVVFSLARGIASIAAKDTLGKTVSKGRRGKVSGYAATGSGLVASAVGLYLVLSPEALRPDWLLYAILIAAGVCWFLAALTFHLITEHPGATEGGRGIADLVRDQLSLLRDDRELQKFLLARTLMISTALVGPAYVSLAQKGLGQTLDGLGWLVIASGLAAAVSSSFWGLLSDRSSRLTMCLAAALAGLLGLAVLASLHLYPEAGDSSLFFAVILFILGIAHAGVRIGRKTQVVDLAGGDRKAEYVALSNTIIGVLLLVMGAVTGVLLGLGLDVAIAALSILALLGAVIAMTMKNAQA